MKQIAAAWPQSRASSVATRSLAVDAIDEVAGEALAEELDRQAKHMPGEPRRLLQRQLQLHAQQRHAPAPIAAAPAARSMTARPTSSGLSQPSNA